MLNKILNTFVITPVLVAGVFVSNAQAQTKPNIGELTSEKSAQKVSTQTQSISDDRIPMGVNKHHFGIGFGQTFLYGDLRDNGISKITPPDLYYNYSASYSFDFMANLHYSKHKYKQNSSEIMGLALAIKAKVFQFDAFSPFFLGGLGFYMPSTKYQTDQGKVSTDHRLVLGLNLGAGAELRLNDQVNIGVIAHYHDPFDVRQEDRKDLGGSYMKLLILAMYSFN